MKLFSFKHIIFICICIFKLTWQVNAEKTEFDKIKEMFSKRLLKQIGSYLFTTNQNNTQCINDILLWYKEFTSRKSLWPFQMVDSWGKIPAGVFTLNLNSFGQFDECINIENVHIKGKYCVAEFTLDPSLIVDKSSNETEASQSLESLKLVFEDGLIHYKNAICLPKSCESDEMEDLLHMIFDVVDVKLNFTIDEENCFTNDPVVWKTIDWIALTIFIFIFLLVVCSTTYELVGKFWTKKEKSGQWYDLMISFSAWSNTKKITSTSNSSGNIKCLNGIRFVSILWIIYHHRCSYTYFIPAINKLEVLSTIKRTIAWTFLSGQFAVDTFFVLSGLLLTYTTFKQLKNGGPFQIISFYRRRLVRITPALAAVLLFYVSFFKYMGEGPVWSAIFSKTEIHRCENYWWTTLLYISNYYNPLEICLQHTWYLSNDMQLYFLSPILIYTILKWKKFGWIHVIFWIFIVQIVRFAIAYHYNFRAATLPFEPEKVKFYFQTHTKANPWLIGFLLGYFLNLKSKLKINKMIVTILWIFSLLIMGVLVISTVHLQNFDRPVNHIEDTTYMAFGRNTWALCLSWIIIACFYGYGGPINWFLSLKIWEIMAKLTFSMYLVHILIIIVAIGSIKSAIFINFNRIVESFFSDTALSIIFGYILAISIEMPFINIESVINKKKDVEKIELKSTPTSIVTFPK